MNESLGNPLGIAAIYLWIGFVGAISFMEAWLKFRAPGVNLQIGLGIGRLVFNALNKAEWVFCFAIIAGIFISRQGLFTLSHLLFYIPLLILVLQSLWLLPALDLRAHMHQKGLAVPASSLHVYYVGLEALKVISLFIYGIQQLNKL